MTDKKAGMIAEWARDYRTAYYNDGLSGERAGEPVRPIIANPDVNPQKVALGFDLYHDTRLSVDNTVSCATCHGLNTGGVDNLQYSKGVENNMGGVNAPTTYNAVYNFVQFWDGRAKTLAEQAAGPPLNPVEMASTSFDEIIAKLAQDEKYVAEFNALYADGITEANITNAIEEFERTLVTPNSQFDKWLLGDNEALTVDELRGYDLFKANNCATCHVGANLGGESYELMGLRQHYFEARGMELTEEDNGRFKQTKNERDRHRFKVPGLRNIELTWPYYHDGTRLTMDEAVSDMARYQCDVELSDADITSIVAFLRTLTGEYQGKKHAKLSRHTHGNRQYSVRKRHEKSHRNQQKAAHQHVREKNGRKIPICLAAVASCLLHRNVADSGGVDNARKQSEKRHKLRRKGIKAISLKSHPRNEKGGNNEGDHSRKQMRCRIADQIQCRPFGILAALYRGLVHK
jgi:cytochrome c peroxidase